MLAWLSNPGVIFWLVGMTIALALGRLLSAAHEDNVRQERQNADAPQTVFQQLTTACLFVGAYAKGIEYAELGLATTPDDPRLNGLLAMNYVGVGDIAKAKVALVTHIG